MDSVLSILLEHIKEQTGYMKQHTSLLTSIDEQHKRLLTSIDGIQAKLNACNLQNKVEEEDHVKNGKREQKVTKINEEVMCDSHVKQLHESPAPWASSCRSRTEGKKYRLHIVGEVGHEAIADENGRLKMNVFRGKQIPRIEVILKHGDEQVPASHHLASLRVELVVLDAKYYIEGSTDWPRKEFEDHLMPVSKNSRNRMTVERGIFSLDGGRKVCTVASINQSSWKQKVRLGVMIVHDGSVQERVLEGVSSNEFYVIHERRGDPTANKERQTTENSELNTNGKRVHTDTTLQLKASYSQSSRHVQSAQKFGQHATGKQPRHARNTGSTKNHSTAPIDAGNIGRTDPPQAAPNSDQGLPASVQMRFRDNHGIPSKEAYEFMPNPPENQSHVYPSSDNIMMRKRVHIDTTLQPSASYSQFAGQVQSTQKFGQHATGKQPSPAQNACLTQNCLATPIRNIRGAVPPNSDQGLPTSVQTRFDDTHGIPSEETHGFLMPNPPDNQGHVDPSSQNLMMGHPAEVTGDTGILSRAEGLPLSMLFQTCLGQVTGDAGIHSCAEGNNGTGGGQGQPAIPQSNNIRTNSQGHITTTAAATDDFTSAQMDINSTMDDLDVEIGGHEQGDGGRVGNGDYGGGNDGGRVGGEEECYFWDQLPSIWEAYGQNSV